jgi:uncharacterized sulfatase
MANSRITRRDLLGGGAAMYLAGGVKPASSKAASRGGARKNVLFIVVDDLTHTLGCYPGAPAIIKTAHIDRLARWGLRFDRAYCQFPVCNPSRSSFLTGLRPDTTGVLDNRVPFRSRLPDAVTLPQLFRQSGYFTARLGKIFHGREGMGDPQAWDVTLDPRATETGRRGEGRNLTGGKVKWCRWLAAEGTDEDQPDGQIAAEAIKLLERDRDKPFFLGVGFHKPHDPFIAPKRYFDLYPLGELEPPREPADATPLHPLAIGSGWKDSFDRFSLRDKREFMRAYYAGVSFIDAQVGKLLDALERLGLRENTIVFFFGDHGYQLGEHGWWNKNTLYEPSTRAPLLVAAPGQTTPGTHCARFVEFVDIYPTLADLCGLAAPANLQGRSFQALLREPDRPWKQAAFTQVNRGVAGRAVRTERWRYIEWDGGRAGVELYDHDSDPGEFHNLGDDPAHADVRRKLAALIRAG